MRSYNEREVAVASVLSGLAGFVDAAGFLHLGGFFVSFMSGNTTRAGASVGEGRWLDAGLAGGLIAAFFVGVVLGSLVSKRIGGRRWVVVGLVSALLFCAAAMHSISVFAFLAPPTMATAMGAENAVFTRQGKDGIALTYVTGAVVKLGQEVAAMIDGERSREWLKYLRMWSGLALGTVLGALTYHAIGLGSLWFAACFAAAATAYLRGRPA